MRRALSVRISDGFSHQMVTRHASGVKFVKQAPGGFFDASCHLRMPLRAFTDLGPADRIYFYDAATGRPVWDGYTKNPTPTSGRGGQWWDITAVGGSVVASDQTTPLIYIDQSLDRWTPALRGTSAAASAGTAPSDTDYGQGLLVQFGSGSFVSGGTTGGGSIASMSYAFPAGLEFGSASLMAVSGKVDAGYTLRSFYVAGSDAGVRLLGNAGAMNQTPAANSLWAGQANVTYQPPVGTTVIQFRLQRTGGATNVNDENTWTFFYDVRMLMRRMDRYGVLKTGQAGMGDPAYVTADLVVEDMLGRVLTMCDPTAAVIEAGTFQIDQLAYPDGVKPSVVLDDLVSLYEPDMDWGIGRTLSNGLHEFWLRRWPTSPRYLLSSDVDIEQSGSDVDLCNRILVTWTDAAGNTVTQAYGQEVPALGAGSPVLPDGSVNPAFVGRVHDADPITLPEGKGSAANATHMATQVLASVSGTTPSAATATFDCRVFDRLRNLFVEPHEIEPGYLARNVATGEDLRLTNVEYDDDAGVASLELGIPVLSSDQRVAQLAKTASAKTA